MDPDHTDGHAFHERHSTFHLFGVESGVSAASWKGGNSGRPGVGANRAIAEFCFCCLQEFKLATFNPSLVIVTPFRSRVAVHVSVS